MKKISLLLVALFCCYFSFAQTEVTFNFNDFLEDTDLNGQHGWIARPHSAGTGGNDIYTGYFGPRGMTTPDETIGVFSVCSGTSYGDIATHSLSEYGFDFSSGGMIEVECDMWREWWGDLFGIGYDGNNDGVVLPPILGNYEPIRPNPNSSSPDGGIYMLTTGISEDNPETFVNGIVLPNNTLAFDFDFEPAGSWYRWKIAIDLDAFDGAGSLTLYMMRQAQGDYEPVAECQGLRIGLTPGSGDKNDPAMWNGIFMLNSGYGGFDNLVIRHIPGGMNSQFITFDAIPDQLTYNPPITLNASASSGLPVSFELVEGPATLSGNVLTLTGEEGQVKVKATQPGDGVEWQPATPVSRTFYVVNPDNYTPEITIRRPYEGTNVYVNDFDNPIMLVLSAYSEHADAIKFEQVTCNIDGETVALRTDYPDNPANGYWYATWTPTQVGSFNLTASITQSGGKVTSVTSTFNVVTDFDDIAVPAYHGDLVVKPGEQTNYGEYAFPSHVGCFNNINLHLEHNCVGTCDPYDRVGYVRVKNYRGEWVELYRYVSPFGVECQDDLDVTDYTTILQGLVEFELYFQTWNGDGYNPTATFHYTKGAPEYNYVDLNELWFGPYDFGDYQNLCPIPTRNFSFADGTQAANLKIIGSGHYWSDASNGYYNTGNAAEFYETTHNIKINGETKYTQHLWRTCNPNPAGCQPQNGTWTYSRSGWCPGSFALVWDFSLDDYLSNGCVDLLYEFDPEYVDQCHPNYPDCVSGQNNCPNCQASDNPVIRVSGAVVSYSNSSDVLMAVSTYDVDTDPFSVSLSPNPVKDQLTLATDYDMGKVCVHIHDINGKEVRNFVMSGTQTIDVSDLAPGVYVVSVIGGKVVNKKLVVA